MLQKLATLLGVPPYQFPRPSYIAGNIATKQKCISSPKGSMWSSRLHIQTSVKHSGKSAFALSGNSVNACLWNIMKHACCPSLCLTVLWGSPLSLCGYRLFFSSENLRCEFFFGLHALILYDTCSEVEAVLLLAVEPFIFILFWRSPGMIKTDVEFQYIWQMPVVDSP